MKKILLISVIILATILRLYDLSNNRPHLTNDEAALGYNAYSILKTGRDEHGALLPVVFESFGDWKPGLYVYSAVPSVAIFGLNEFSTRLPSALAGVTAVIFIFKLTNLMFKSERIALLSAFFLSISHWHLIFSRGAWEANLALTLTLIGTYYLYKFTQDNKKSSLILSALFFGLTLWAYQSAKLASFLILLGFTVIFRKKLLKFKDIQTIFLAGLVGAIIALPVIFSLFSGKSGRLSVMSVFSNARSDQYIEDSITSHGESEDDITFELFHSESYNFSRGIFGRYFNHFAGRFLFFEGDWANARHTSPNIGYLLLIDAPFLLIGIITAVQSYKKKEYTFILYWLAISPLASALSRDSIHGIRSMNMLVPLTILLAVGVDRFIQFTQKWNYFYKYPIYLILSLIYLYNFAFMLDAYFIHAPIRDSKSFMYGYKQVVEKVLPVQDKYEEIVVNKNFDQAYIFFLFYGAGSPNPVYEPSEYQKTDYFEESPIGDVGMITQLGNIKFRPINWSADKHQTGLLLIGRETKFPMYELEDNKDYSFERIRYLDGSNGFVIAEIIR